MGNVDVAGLAAQLAAGRVAFERPLDDVPAITAAVTSTQSRGTGSLGFAALETTPERPGDLRDIAQDLQLATDLNTVIVRTPHATAAVSDTLSRAQIETGEQALIAEPDYALGVEAFGQQAAEFAVNWFAFVVLVAVVVAAVVAVTQWAVKEQRRDAEN